MPKKSTVPKPRSGPKRKAKPRENLPVRWTARQRQFVKEYLIDLNATQAAIRAGYSKNTAKEIGCENLTKPHIAAEVAKHQEKRNKRIEIESDYVVQKLKLIADSDFTKVAKWGTDSLEHTDSDKLGPAEAAAIRGVKMGKFGLEVQMVDPTPALKLLGEHTGAWQSAPQQAQMIQVNIVVDDKREVKKEIVVKSGGNGKR